MSVHLWKLSYVECIIISTSHLQNNMFCSHWMIKLQIYSTISKCKHLWHHYHYHENSGTSMIMSFCTYIIKILRRYLKYNNFGLIWCWSHCFTLKYFQIFNTLRPRQNGRHFPDAIFQIIFLNENLWISINVSLKFVPRGQINNIPALVQIMAWRRSGDKPLSEPMMVKFTDAYMHHSASMS